MNYEEAKKRHDALQIEDMHCPTCGSKPHEPCKTRPRDPNQKPLIGIDPHKTRENARDAKRSEYAKIMRWTQGIVQERTLHDE